MILKMSKTNYAIKNLKLKRENLEKNTALLKEILGESTRRILKTGQKAGSKK